VREKLSEGFKALVDTKRRQLAGSYGASANLAGQAEVILEAKDDMP
jgi:hypothetical protein